MTKLSLFLAFASLTAGCGGSSGPPASTNAASSATAPTAEVLANERATVGGAFFGTMADVVTSYGGAVVNGAFYVVGGYRGEPHRYSVEGQSRDIMKLSLSAPATWTRVAQLPYGLQGLGVVGHRDELCRFGGNRVLNTQNEKTSMISVSDAACWDTKTGKWRTLPPLPTGRSSLDAVMVGSTVWLAGGWRLGDGQTGSEEGEWASDVLRLDLDAPSPRWTSIPVPVRTRAAALVAASGKLYLMGGLGADKETSRAVQILDVASGAWSRGPELPTDGFGMAAIASETGDRIFATTREGSVLELRSGAWSELGKLTFPRMFHRLAWARPSQMLVIGGITGMQRNGRTKVIETFDVEGKTKAPEIGRLEIPFPGHAKNREAFFVHGDFLYVVGGNNSLEQHDFEPSNFVDEGHRLHIPSLGWTAAAPYPHKRQSMQVAWIGDKLLALGGFGHNGNAAVSFNEGYWFDPKSEKWTAAPGLPAGRTQFGLASHRDKIYVFGGLNYDPQRKQSFDHVTNNLVAAAESQTFGDLGAPLPGPRRAFGGATVGDEYFIIGGMRENFKLVDDCTRYSFTTKKYSSMPCPPVGRLSAKVLALKDKIYIAGGESRPSDGGDLEPNRSIEVFDPKTSQWSTVVADVGFDTHHASALVYRDAILMASTQNKNGSMTLAFVRP
jgi:N-acetylneuraminic acid mutarotase